MRLLQRLLTSDSLDIPGSIGVEEGAHVFLVNQTNLFRILLRF